MSEEKNDATASTGTKLKAKVKRGTGSLERKAKGRSAEEVIAECERKEAQLFAQRGYGGYIDTEEVTAIRKIKADAQGRLPKNVQRK